MNGRPTDPRVDRIDTDEALRLQVDAMTDALGMLRVLSKEGKDVGKVLPLRGGEVLIGRCENGAHGKWTVGNPLSDQTNARCTEQRTTRMQRRPA